MNKTVLVLPLVVFSLLAAIWGGWIRIGVDLPATAVAGHHGGLMVNGFLASLIFLERAVTFRNKLVLLLPFLNALGSVLAIAGLASAGLILQAACAMGFMTMCAWFIYRYKEFYYYIFFAGAFCLFAGNLVLYQTQLYPAATIWWMQFLLFTIVAERLELTRFLPPDRRRQALLVIILSCVLLTAFIPYHAEGNIAFAIAVAATAAWLLKYDMAFRSVKTPGQHRYSALLLITGYAWLLVTAVVLFTEKSFVFGYDALLHSFFIGFVFAMIFSHAPVIFPAVARMSIKIYRPILYLWFVLLQLSLVWRVVADLGGWTNQRRLAGFINGTSILLFFISIAAIVAIELRKKRKRSVA